MSAFGLDVGTSSVKGLALAEDGTALAAAEEGYPFATPRPGWTEQDPELWWQAAQPVLAALRAAAGEPAGIGLSGQMHGLVALDGADRVVRPALLWNDQRTGAEAAEIERRLGGLEGLVAATGNRALTGFTAPKLLWMAHHEPDLYARVRSVMLPKDYVRLRLCGERATDVTDASGTLWFDVAARAWSDRVLEALEVDPAWLPPALESPAVSGRTPEGVPVAAGAGDQGAGAVGEAWTPGVEGLTFLPYLTGERTPHADPDATGAFAGLTVRHDRGALARAVLEGVAFGLRDALDLVGREEVEIGRVSGGGARSELWLRILASVLEVPLERVAVDEGAAYGAALLGGVAGGVWSTVEEAAQACVRVRGVVEPVPAWIAAYREARERFRALYPALSRVPVPGPGEASPGPG